MLAVLLRVLIPAGFMLAAGSDHGASKIVVCSGQGAVEVMVDSHGHRIKAPADHGKGKGGDRPCAFAAMATAPLNSNQALKAAPAVYASLAPTAQYSAQRPGLGLAAPPPPKTGPPLSI